MRAWTVSLALIALVNAVDPLAAAAAPVTGQVVRPPAATRQPVNVNRYRERTPARDETSDDTVASCGCRPGEFAVVYLTSEDSLASPSMPLEPPVMAQKDRSFVPAVLAIPVGASVDFPNMDPYFHNVFSYSKTKKFDLGRYPRGEIHSVRFEESGVVPIFCEIHYSMRAYIHVLDTPYFAVSDESRRFEIADVPPGEYVLHVWQENLPALEVPVTVGNGPLHLVVP